MDLVLYEDTGNVTIASLTANRLTADIARQTFDDLLAHTKSAHAVLLDFGEIEFMDSTGTGELVQFSKKLRSRGTPLSIAALSTHLMELIRMMRLDSIMVFSQSREQGLDALRGHTGEVENR